MNMKVSQISFNGLQQANKTGNKKVDLQKGVMTTPIAPVKNDTFTKSEFNLEDAVKTLRSINVKHSSGAITPKFNNTQVAYIQNELRKAPEKWDSVNALAHKEHLIGQDVMRLSRVDTDRLDTVKKYSDVVTHKAKPRYTGSQLIEFAYNGKVKTQGLKNALPLAKTSLSPKNIMLLADRTPEFLKKASDVVVEFENDVLKNDVVQIAFSRDNADREAFNVMAKTSKNEVHSVLLDKNLNKDAIEKISLYRSEGGKTYEIKKANDFRNNTTSKVRMEIGKDNYPVVTHEVRVIKDKNNKVVKTEYTSPSEIPGIFDIRVKHADGKEEIVSSGKYDKKTGITTIKKNMVSLDGTRTDYLFENDENGNRISDYKITDKNGRVLLNKSATFEVVSPNKIISSNNDDKFEILLDEKTIKVTDMKNPKRNAVIDIDKKIQGNKKKILASLKQMPGEELIKLAQSTKKLVGIDSPIESYYRPADKSIHSSDQLFVILHELGHARDMRDVDASSQWAYMESIGKSVFTNTKLEKTFEEEKANFNKAFPDAQRDHIDYFVNTLNHYGGAYGGLRETIAEGSAILNTPKTMDILAIRTQYLQQYFPKTIAHLSKLVSREAGMPEVDGFKKSGKRH